MNEATARAAFLQAVNKLYRGVPAQDVHVVRDPAVAVPGFVAFEVAAAPPLRGWADDVVGVLARRQNFAPVLEALRFRAEPSPAVAELVARLVWAHGPPYTLAGGVAAGELGAAEAIDLTPSLARRDDGSTVLTFALRDPGGDGEPACVFQYTIIGHGEDSYRISTRQIAPAGA